MKLGLKFIAIRVARHAPPDRPNDITESVRLIPLVASSPRHDASSHENTVALWPNGADGELNLSYVDPEIVKNIDAGTVIGVTLEIPD